MQPYFNMKHIPLYAPATVEQGEAMMSRWQEGDILKTLPTYAYFPFGGGTRVCIGNNIALMEAVLLLAVIGQKYRFTLADGANVVPEPLITLMPSGLEMVIHKR